MAFEVEQVVGSGSVQELLCQTINLGTCVEEIKEIRKTVIVDNCLVVFDKVIIDGRLRKDIMFKQANAGFPKPGTVQGCAGITTTITGPILDVDVEIAFNALVPVPGAQPGDKCVVLQAFVEGEKEEPANIQHTGAFTALVDKSIIFLCVKVVRDVVTNNLQAGGVAAVGGVVTGGGFAAGGVTAGAGVVLDGGAGRAVGLCPVRRSTGFFPGGNGVIPRAQPGPFLGTWVGPTLVFPGVLNPGVPTLVPGSNTILAPGGSQIQVTPVQTVTDTTTAGGVVAAGGVITAGGSASSGVIVS